MTNNTFAGFTPVATQQFTITAVKPGAGSTFTKRWNVDLDGKPFAMIGKFTKEQGGNYYVGFASTPNGGRFATYAEAEKFVLANA
jgi:hypothetical protein